jgi:hypothetical protein
MLLLKKWRREIWIPYLLRSEITYNKICGNSNIRACSIYARNYRADGLTHVAAWYVKINVSFSEPLNQMANIKLLYWLLQSNVVIMSRLYYICVERYVGCKACPSSEAANSSRLFHPQLYFRLFNYNRRDDVPCWLRSRRDEELVSRRRSYLSLQM